LQQYTDSLYEKVSYYDSIWINQNDKNFRYNFNAMVAKMRSAYKFAVAIDSITEANKLIISDDCKDALFNVKYWFKSSMGDEAGRDEYMANMAIRFAQRKDCKLIVWAHEVHLALKSAYNDNSVGGTGGFIKKQMPGYYVLGLGTATGTYSATTERFDTRTNPMQPYPLATVRNKTWDKVFADLKTSAFVTQSSKVNNALPKLPLRVVGYGTNSDDYSDKNALNELFDAYIFIAATTAANHDL
jgi:erythromycin esterase